VGARNNVVANRGRSVATLLTDHVAGPAGTGGDQVPALNHR
jgi:hypothetical protein